jgi:hypothetical protein
VSAAVDALRAALEAMQEAVQSAAGEVETGALADIESEVDTLRDALTSARTALQDAHNEVRAAIARAREIVASATKLCEPDADDCVDANEIANALDDLGGPDSATAGPLDDLDSTADALASAADEITAALGDGEGACSLLSSPGGGS